MFTQPGNSSAGESSRRTFLKTTSVAFFAPAILNAEDKSESKKKVLGNGEHKYEADHYWGEAPKGFSWNTTHGVCVDEAGLIYIKQRGAKGQPTILVFDPKGKFVRSFGQAYAGGGHGIDVRKEDGEEFLYLSDTLNRQVIKTNLKGEELWKLPFPAESKLYKNAGGYRPTNVAFAPDGGFYIGDGYGSHFIHQYDADAKWVRSWGGAGTEPGKMKTPHGLWVDNRPGREPSIAVADRANARLQYFSLDGKHLGFVEDMSFPADVDTQGDILLVPDLHARVTLLNAKNELIAHLGYDADWTKKALAGFKMRTQPANWEEGRFVHPHDACFDHDGNIFVTEWVSTGRITKLRKLG